MNELINIDVRSNIFIWANTDLDGAVSTIILGNIFKKFEYRSVFFGKFEEIYLAWAKKNLENYDKVFIVGMVLSQDLIKHIDDPRVVLISDMDDTFNAFDSTLIVEKCSSCSKLLYKKFKDTIVFEEDLIKLIAYADDYNKYELNYEESMYLNAIYRRMGFQKFNSFVKRFWNGYDGLTKMEFNLAESYFEDIRKELEELDQYKGEWEGYTLISTCSKCCVNEISKELLDNHDVDAIIVVNPESNYVSFRKRKTSNIDIKSMAIELCGGGGGEYASGGRLTKRFMEFSETLIEL